MPISDYASLITGGSTIAGVGLTGFIAYTVQSRTNRQNRNWQWERDYSDRQATSYVDMISALLRSPSHEEDPSDDYGNGLNYIDSIRQFRNDLAKAYAPLFAYGDPTLFSQFEGLFNRLDEGITEMSDLLEDEEFPRFNHHDRKMFIDDMVKKHKDMREAIIGKLQDNLRDALKRSAVPPSVTWRQLES